MNWPAKGVVRNLVKESPGHIVLPADKVDAYAIQALINGEASPDQAAQAVKCIIYELCGTYGEPFDPESSRWTDFNLGKRSVGRTLVNIGTATIGLIYQVAEEREEKRNLPPTKVTRKRDKGET